MNDCIVPQRERARIALEEVGRLSKGSITSIMKCVCFHIEKSKNYSETKFHLTDTKGNFLLLIVQKNILKGLRKYRRKVIELDDVKKEKWLGEDVIKYTERSEIKIVKSAPEMKWLRKQNIEALIHGCENGNQVPVYSIKEINERIENLQDKEILWCRIEGEIVNGNAEKTTIKGCPDFDCVAELKNHDRQVNVKYCPWCKVNVPKSKCKTKFRLRLEIGNNEENVWVRMTHMIALNTMLKKKAVEFSKLQPHEKKKAVLGLFGLKFMFKVKVEKAGPDTFIKAVDVVSLSQDQQEGRDEDESFQNQNSVSFRNALHAYNTQQLPVYSTHSLLQTLKF